MYFSNLNTKIFLELKTMSKDCLYSVSNSWRCWKFMFNNEIGIALIKQSEITEEDKWSAVAIKKNIFGYSLIDDPWINIKESSILIYANLIKKLYS